MHESMNQLPTFKNCLNPGPAEHEYAPPLQAVKTQISWSGSALLVIQFVNFYQQSDSSNMIGC